MVKTGKLKISGSRAFGDMLERSNVVLNIVTNDNDGVAFVYVNKEQRIMEVSSDGGTSWEASMDEADTDYKVYVGKTIDNLVAMYKLHSENTITWLAPLTEVTV